MATDDYFQKFESVISNSHEATTIIASGNVLNCIRSKGGDNVYVPPNSVMNTFYVDYIGMAFAKGSNLTQIFTDV